MLEGTGLPYQINWHNSSGTLTKQLVVEWLGSRVSAEDRRIVRENIRTSPFGDPARNARIAREVPFRIEYASQNRIYGIGIGGEGEGVVLVCSFNER